MRNILSKIPVLIKEKYDITLEGELLHMHAPNVYVGIRITKIVTINDTPEAFKIITDNVIVALWSDLTTIHTTIL